jgi:hypothetical protein
MYSGFGGPPRHGTILVIASLIGTAGLFIRRPGRYWNTGPSLYERFQSGTASDVDILFSLAMIIFIAYRVAVMILDIRSTGRWW